MAGLPVQVGDIFALAKVAKTVIEYGWGEYSNAGRFYVPFNRKASVLRVRLRE